MSATISKQSSDLLPYSALEDDQHDAIAFAFEYDFSILRLPMGFGKTIVSLTAIQECLEAGVFTRCLVVAPARPAQGTWREEPGKWEHINADQIAYCLGGEKSRIAALEENKPITVINYENIPWLFNTYYKKRGDHGFDACVVDELTRLKEVGGATYKALRRERKHFKWVCGLTGSMEDDGLEDLYGQVLFIDHGARLGRRKDRFLTKYFYPTDFQRRNWEPFDWASEEIAKLIADITYIPDVAKYEASLPEHKIIYHDVPFTQPAKKLYRKLVADSFAEVDGADIEAVNAGVLSGKLEQLTAGFLYHEVDGERQAVEVHREKINKAYELVRTLERECPVLVSFWFTWEREQLQELFPDAPVISSGMTATQLRDVCKRWNAGEVPVLLIHPRSGGHGLNLQFSGWHLVSTTMPWSADVRNQITARLRRRGQKAPVVYTHYVTTAGSIDTGVKIPRKHKKADTKAMFLEHLLACRRG